MTTVQIIAAFIAIANFVVLTVVVLTVRATRTLLETRYQLEIDIRRDITSIRTEQRENHDKIRHRLDMLEQIYTQKLEAQQRVINMHQKLYNQYREKIPLVATPETAGRWSSEHERRHSSVEEAVSALKLEIEKLSRRLNRVREVSGMLNKGIPDE